MTILTAKDVREHRFQTVRFKEGYDVEEVDDFLDQVSDTIDELDRQIVWLRAQLGNAGASMPGVSVDGSATSAPVVASAQASMWVPPSAPAPAAYATSVGSEPERPVGNAEPSAQLPWNQ